MRIDDEFKNLLPPHTAEEYAQLVENCKADPRDEVMPPVQITIEEDAQFRIPFDKNRERELRSVPRSYLEWVLSVERASQAFRELQCEVRECLGISEQECGPSGRWGRGVDVEPENRLTREYLVIVRSC